MEGTRLVEGTRQAVEDDWTWWRAHGCGCGGGQWLWWTSDVVEGTAAVVEGTLPAVEERRAHGCGGGHGAPAVVDHRTWWRGTWLWFLQKSGMPSTLLLQVRSECNGKMASNFRSRSWPSSAPFIEDDPCATSFPRSSLHAMKDVVFPASVVHLRCKAGLKNIPYIWN